MATQHATRRFATHRDSKLQLTSLRPTVTHTRYKSCRNGLLFSTVFHPFQTPRASQARVVRHSTHDTSPLCSCSCEQAHYRRGISTAVHFTGRCECGVCVLLLLVVHSSCIFYSPWYCVVLVLSDPCVVLQYMVPV